MTDRSRAAPFSRDVGHGACRHVSLLCAVFELLGRRRGARQSGALYVGCNVENAAFPQGSCAEASAISALIMAGERRIIECWSWAMARRW